MIDKMFYKTLLKKTFSDPIHITFWDGETVQYGEGTREFKLTFYDIIPKGDLLHDPSIAFGEAFMDGKIEVEGNLKELIASMYRSQESFLGNNQIYAKLLDKFSNTKKRSKENATFHYDIGNEFYKLWLDETMTYSCGYFRTADDSLMTAQQNKVAHILKKLNLREGDTLLDIGCGWGELILTAAKRYGVKATGVTLSEEQYGRVKERIIEEQHEDSVDVRLMDYRDIKHQQFDRIVSVGMIEHVGQDHLEEYFQKVNELLIDGGVSVLHSITSPKDGGTNSWIDKYIFPGGYIPAVNELVRHITEHNFLLTDLESLRRHYAKTLEKWAENFENVLEEVRKSRDERFIRMWRLYLNSCSASFQTGNIDLSQFIFTKGTNNSIPWTRDYMYK
ncbi:SAM-dependent methyltransferase [Halobacillus naozhouensis]|uniref:Cyclopropane-fatty-acyl-phospholipid synthase n=1 Tax=Halobacillus naozhouensis TaxID=554880 RepID=A0ABY8J0W7_9BACI|nr:cyclopropane-fatty-acyl-phospholipid synthase family protein [Halobacillus naozhouensis]WFT75237.1 cyclopropane-fatty-acyl-phospholipid synthase [Halobacillus naozhouensis]